MLPDYRKRYLAEFLLKLEEDYVSPVTESFTKALRLKQAHTPEELQAMLLQIQDQLDQNRINPATAHGKMIPIIGALIA